MGRKLADLRRLLADLGNDIVGAASDLLFHLLAEGGLTPASYREAFRLAGDAGLVPLDLAGRPQLAAGMRNLIVHMYEEIDDAIIRQSIGPLVADFGPLVAVAEGWEQR